MRHRTGQDEGAKYGRTIGEVNPGPLGKTTSKKLRWLLL